MSENFAAFAYLVFRRPFSSWLSGACRTGPPALRATPTGMVGMAIAIFTTLLPAKALPFGPLS